jgi:DNA-directed RNA polymerase subunit RPC12/RpoP
MVAMVEPSGVEEPEPTGWAFVRMVVREFVHDMRHPAPRTVRYLRCDGCGQVTPHSSDRRLYAIANAEVTAPPPEAVCDECGHAQPRAVGDEIPADVTVTCVGRRHRRIGLNRSRHRCGREFAVPAAASSVLCPWCSTVQPGPRRPDSYP